MPVASPWYLSATPLTVRPWLIRLSLITALLDAVVVAVAVGLPGADFPLRQPAAMVAVSGLANGLMALALWRGRSVPAPLAVLALLVEVVLLAWLLDLTGGPFNPFAVVFGVYVALAGVALGRGPATVVAAGAAVAYGALLYLHTLEDVALHHRLNDFPTHLFTMWIAVAATAELAAYFRGAGVACARRDAAPGDAIGAAGVADHARLDVRDCGPGMSPEVLARAGEPFFTTRGTGRGLGLGLFLARVFAERSGGALSIASGAGTTVTLDLPLAAPDADPR